MYHPEGSHLSSQILGQRSTCITETEVEGRNGGRGGGSGYNVGEVMVLWGGLQNMDRNQSIAACSRSPWSRWLCQTVRFLKGMMIGIDIQRSQTTSETDFSNKTIYAKVIEV